MKIDLILSFISTLLKVVQIVTNIDLMLLVGVQTNIIY